MYDRDMNLSVRIGASSYLSNLLVQFPEYQAFVRGDLSVGIQELNIIDLAIQHSDAEFADDTEAYTLALREQKNRFSVLWSIAAMTESMSFAELGKAQSQFAVSSVHSALQAAMASAPVSKLYGGLLPSKTNDCGLFILAMGKLGGRDLNFSSDIDLVAFYDKDKFVCPRMQGATFVVTQILHQLSTILTGKAPNELIWRVDWRLRPHASLRNLSMPTHSADDFYHYHAQPWHRLAMIKARVIAGDKGVGEQFLSDLSSFLWRHDLDYRALDDLESLKHKINREHPELKTQRSQSKEERSKAQSYNLKLGAGGIREIEFVVNALQLIWGGRKPELRITNTLSALNKLAQLGLYGKASAQSLAAAYQFHRNAENALQMLENTQHYHLPETAGNQNKLLTILGIEQWDDFQGLLSDHRQAVSQEFALLFADKHDSGKLFPEESREYAWDQTDLSEKARETISLWKDGFRNYGVHEGYTSSLKRLAKELDCIIKDAQLDANDAILRLDSFFHRLPQGGQYFRLLQEYPALLDKLIQPLFHSEAMAILLQQSPHIIDRFLEDCVPLKSPNALDTSIVFYTDDFETRLQNLRRLANEELYLIYLQYFNSEISPRQVENQLSYLARSLIEACLKVTCDELNLKASPIAVIGFGKLGMAAMMPMSDLDLVFLFDDISDLHLASQFASKLTTVISTPMKQGRVYELDTRLRPSGKLGAATISLSSFELHQIEHAHTWAHLALVPASFVAGNKQVGDKFTKLKSEILSKPRDLMQYKNDCLKMLERIKKQRTLGSADNQFVSKLRPGGLSELEYLICCQAIVQFQGKPNNWPVSFDEIAKHVANEQSQDLDEALLFMRDFQLEVRLFGDEQLPLTKLKLLVRNHLMRVFSTTSLEETEQKMQSYTRMTKQFEQVLFADIDAQEMQLWTEQNINWR